MRQLDLRRPMRAHRLREHLLSKEDQKDELAKEKHHEAGFNTSSRLPLTFGALANAFAHELW